jgi:hypothetical protein
LLFCCFGLQIALGVFLAGGFIGGLNGVWALLAGLQDGGAIAVFACGALEARNRLEGVRARDSGGPFSREGRFFAGARRAPGSDARAAARHGN